MHRLPVLPLGVKFDPTDDQLILGYLGPKVRGERLAWDVIDFSDLVYKKPPWEFCTDLTAFLGDEKHYFFTELKKMNQNRVIRTIGSYGTWHQINCEKIFGENIYINNNNKGIIGFNKLLNFQVKGEGKEMKNTDWSMHEFSLPGKETNLVLCVIQKKKKKGEEMGSACGKCPEFDPIFFLVRDSATSAGGDPSPAPAPAHDDQALDSEEEEARPSKKMRSDTKLDDDPVSVASSSVDFTPDFLRELAADLLEVPVLPRDESGLLDYELRDDLFDLPNDVFFDF